MTTRCVCVLVSKCASHMPPASCQLRRDVEDFYGEKYIAGDCCFVCMFFTLRLLYIMAAA